MDAGSCRFIIKLNLNKKFNKCPDEDVVEGSFTASSLNFPPFITLYGMRIFGVLSAVLVAGGAVIALYGPPVKNFSLEKLIPELYNFPCQLYRLFDQGDIQHFRGIVFSMSNFAQ